MSPKVKSNLAIAAVILTSILFMDLWWSYAFEVREGTFFNITRFGFVAIFVLVYNLSWGIMNGLVQVFKWLGSLFTNKDASETDSRTGASIVIFLGIVIGFIWGILGAIFSEHVGLFNGVAKMTQIGLIYGILIFALIRMRIILFNESLAEGAVDVMQGGSGINGGHGGL
jgi:hypothetical protein